MIISHTHKYLFIELPMTGSTAISKELREQYDGVSILQKHSTYLDFLRVANEAEKQYFVFAGIRHPLDQVVSHYFKFKTGHDGQFTAEEHLDKLKKNCLFRLAYGYSHMARYRFIQEHNADFATFFLKFYRAPYNNWSSMAHRHFDYVIHFEHLAEDFERAIAALGLTLKRPLPVRNKTAEKATNFFSYYDTPTLQQRAMQVFGPFMEQWSYDFPDEWTSSSISLRSRAEYRFLNVFRNVYWRYLRRPMVAVKDSVTIEEARQRVANQSL